MPARNGGGSKGSDPRALILTDIHIIECNNQFSGALVVTGSISEKGNGRRAEMAVVAKEAIPEQSSRWIYV